MQNKNSHTNAPGKKLENIDYKTIHGAEFPSK
jgi:hypothetical protein